MESKSVCLKVTNMDCDLVLVDGTMNIWDALNFYIGKQVFTPKYYGLVLLRKDSPPAYISQYAPCSSYYGCYLEVKKKGPVTLAREKAIEEEEKKRSIGTAME